MTSTYIALLRAVNVGGVASLPTKDLVRLLEKLGLAEVRTYIQSGNAVFRASRKQAARLPAKIRAAIGRKLGFAPEVILLRLEDLESAIAANPYPEAESAPASLHLDLPRLGTEDAGPGGAGEAPQSRTSALRSREKSSTCTRPTASASRSSPRASSVRSASPAPARNWRTACKLVELAREITRT